jgi:hypothetical protein
MTGSVEKPRCTAGKTTALLRSAQRLSRSALSEIGVTLWREGSGAIDAAD